MLIKEFAEATGVSRDAIRFYEKRGLLEPARQKGGANRYRSYSEKDLERLEEIRMGQALGFTLAEIKRGLEGWRGGALDQATKILLMAAKLEDVQGKIRELRSTEQYLRRKLAWIRGGETGPRPALPGVSGRRTIACG